MVIFADGYGITTPGGLTVTSSPVVSWRCSKRNDRPGMRFGVGEMLEDSGTLVAGIDLVSPSSFLKRNRDFVCPVVLCDQSARTNMQTPQPISAAKRLMGRGRHERNED